MNSQNVAYPSALVRSLNGNSRSGHNQQQTQQQKQHHMQQLQQHQMQLRMQLQQQQHHQQQSPLCLPPKGQHIMRNRAGIAESPINGSSKLSSAAGLQAATTTTRTANQPNAASSSGKS